MGRFLYRAKIYEIEERHVGATYLLLLPEKKVLVVDRWESDMIWSLSDIRALPEEMTDYSFLLQAQEQGKRAGIVMAVSPLPGEKAEPYAVMDVEGKRYAFPTYWQRNVNDGYVVVDDKVYRLDAWEDSTQRHVHAHHLVEPGSHDERMLEGWTPVLSQEVPALLPGLARDPYDLRIRFFYAGVDYLLSDEAYRERKGIYIPGKGFFRPGGWLESMPVQIERLLPVREERKGALHEYIVAVPFAQAIDTTYYEYGK